MRAAGGSHWLLWVASQNQYGRPILTSKSACQPGGRAGADTGTCGALKRAAERGTAPAGRVSTGESSTGEGVLLGGKGGGKRASTKLRSNSLSPTGTEVADSADDFGAGGGVGGGREGTGPMEVVPSPTGLEEG